MKNRDDLIPGDDGEPVADMNVEGMPWFTLKPHDKTGSGSTPMSKEETRAYAWASLKAGLLIALIFGTVFFLFLLFADYVWLR